MASPGLARDIALERVLASPDPLASRVRVLAWQEAMRSRRRRAIGYLIMLCICIYCLLSMAVAYFQED
jgi:hypothetical protein